jgi:hypothetical protein
MDANAPGCGWSACWAVALGNVIIGLAVECPDRRYFGLDQSPGTVYDHVLQFLRQNYGRKLREVMDAEIDMSEIIQ